VLISEVPRDNPSEIVEVATVTSEKLSLPSASRNGKADGLQEALPVEEKKQNTALVICFDEEADQDALRNPFKKKPKLRSHVPTPAARTAKPMNDFPPQPTPKTEATEQPSLQLPTPPAKQ
jgi:hypothetical protein